MHEMALAENVIRLVEAAAERAAAKRVSLVVLEIGRLAAVEPQALRFCFQAVARGGIAEGAQLDIVDIPGAGCCADCGAVMPLESRIDVCDACGSPRLTVTAGGQMRVREIGIE